MENIEIKREYYDNGRVSTELPILNGMLHGWMKWFNEYGMTECKVFFKYGEAHGFDFSYNSFGKMKHINKWKNSTTKTGPQIAFIY